MTGGLTVHVLDLGDSTYAVPVSLLIIAWVAVCARSLKTLVVWIGCLGACLCAVGLAKLWLMVGVSGLSGRAFSPSGHAAVSAFFFGLLSSIIIAQVRFIPGRILGVIPGAALAMVIGVALVHRGDHTPPEVILGLGWGWIWLGLGLRYAGPLRTTALQCGLFALPLALGITYGYSSVSSGNRSQSEFQLRHLALVIRNVGWRSALESTSCQRASSIITMARCGDPRRPPKNAGL